MAFNIKIFKMNRIKTSLEKVPTITQFAFKNRFLSTPISLFLFVLVIWLVYRTNNPAAHIWNISDKGLTWWAEWLDPIIGLGIFVTTLWIGIAELRQDWEQSLEKRLTVYFKLKDRTVMTCHKAYLSDVADVRMLGQQIGAQMARVFLDFEANKIVSKKDNILKSESKTQVYYIHYIVTFQLRRLPQPSRNTSEVDKKHIARFERENLIWDIPEHQNDTITQDKWKPYIQMLP